MRYFYLLMTSLFLISGCEGNSSNNGSQWSVDKATVGKSQVTLITGFKGPYGLSLHDNGKLYVPDIRDGRVIRFSNSLDFERWLGYSLESQTSGWFDETYSVDASHEESLKGAHSVAFDSLERVIVADFYNKTVNIYDSSGNFLGYVNNTPSDLSLSFEGPANVAFDKSGNLWVSDWTSHRVFKFDSGFNFIGWLGATASGPTNGFVQSGTAISSAELGGFNKPHMVKVDDEGYLYVVETGNHRVQKFDSQGQSIGWIGAKQSGGTTDGFDLTGQSIKSDVIGGFENPVSLQLYDNKKLIVADNANNRVQSFDLDGKFEGWIGASKSSVFTDWTNTDSPAVGGKDAGYFSAPFDAVQIGNKLYVADGHNNRIQIYEFD